VIEVAEIFRCYGPAYRDKFNGRLLPSHLQAMQDIEQCRTEALGGHLFSCEACQEIRYSYHSCQNRHCPKCQNQTAQQWLAQQQALLLPVPYFMVTFTLPAGLKPLARSHQKLCYNLLFQASAAALQELAGDPRFVGGQIGMIGVLHTWTRDLRYHPHVHYLVPAGGLSPDGQTWLRARNAFLVHVKPLSHLFRAKFRAALRQTELYDRVPEVAWTQDWVVHCQPVGQGRAALKYLAPYVFRVAISNSRLLKVEDDQVTFRYKASDTGRFQLCTVPAEEFIRRFLQHVLPKGFVKVRYYGLFSPAYRAQLAMIRQALGAPEPAQPDPTVQSQPPATEPSLACPKCGQPMRLVQTVPRQRCRSP
jgi:hypothetical protein